MPYGMELVKIQDYLGCHQSYESIFRSKVFLINEGYLAPPESGNMPETDLADISYGTYFRFEVSSFQQFSEKLERKNQ